MKLYQTTRYIGVLLSTLAILLIGNYAAAEDVKPSGTLTLKETEVGLLLGGDWARAR